MCCVVKCIWRRNKARVKNADLRHLSRTVVMQRRKSALPILNVLMCLLIVAYLRFWCQNNSFSISLLLSVLIPNLNKSVSFLQ